MSWPWQPLTRWPTVTLPVADETAHALAWDEAESRFQAALRQCFGHNLYDTQLEAARQMASGATCEMQTGEGKTLAIAFAASLLAQQGRTVHVVTSNDYLAQRDARALQPLFAKLGYSCHWLDASPPGQQPVSARDAVILYGASHRFGFEYLASVSNQHRPIVHAALIHDAVLIDEIDHVLADDAISPLVLSEQASNDGTELARWAACSLAAKDCAESLGPGDYFLKHQRVSLTRQGVRCIYRLKPDLDLQLPWHQWVHLALRAKYEFRRDVHYTVVDDQICFVDPSTGRLHLERKWPNGLHQALEAKENVPPTPATREHARITRQRFFQRYHHLCGCSGTIMPLEDEFESTYGTPTVVIATRLASRRTEEATRLANSFTKMIDALAAEAIEVAQIGRAVLIVTLNLETSQRVALVLRSRCKKVMQLDGRQDAEESHAIALAGQSGRITVATQIAGRGTDIRVCDEVLQRGGLHVITVGIEPTTRYHRQAIGRCARSGQPGSHRCYVSLDDQFFDDHARLHLTLSRQLTADCVQLSDAAASDLKGHIRRSQQANEVEMAKLRRQQQSQDRILHGDELNAQPIRDTQSLQCERIL